MFTAKIHHVKVASATVYSNTCKNFLLMHRPNLYSTSRKLHWLRNMAKRKKRHDKTAGFYNLKISLSGNLIKQEMTV